MQRAFAILSSVVCWAVQYFAHFLVNGTIFGGGVERKMGVFIFSTTFV